MQYLCRQISTKMRRLLTTSMLLTVVMCMSGQRVLSLDDCRQLALANNKQMTITEVKQQKAEDTRKAARTKFLPSVDAVAGYEWTSREISILSDEQKDALSHLGTNASGRITTTVNDVLTKLVQDGVLSPQAAAAIGERAGNIGAAIQQLGDGFGDKIRDAFHTDTRQIWAGAVTVKQPLYMGGAITAANRLADLNVELLSSQGELSRQNTLYSVDEAYWLVVTLRQKQRLADNYTGLVKQLSDDVHKMIKEGVATRSDGLKVDVSVNEAEMKQLQANDGVTLSKMLLCQLCGLPLDSDITLRDEQREDVMYAGSGSELSDSVNYSARPELHMLHTAIEMSEANEALVKAAYRPQVALTAGYLISNPSTYSGFERKFKGMFNVGVMARIPIWSWREGHYKANAAKAATTIAQLEYDEVNEKMELQTAQSRFKLREARKKYEMSMKNIQSAEENLRCATLGFREGVMTTTDVMAAQTAWEMAQSEKIDAEADLRMSEINLRKSLGVLR